MRRPTLPARRLVGPAVALLLAIAAAPAAGQGIGALVSPGPLSKAHEKLEGIENCQKCHEPGRKVTAQRCLACHKPIAERIAAKKGVHRDVKGDCVSCHIEHAGRDAEIRPVDRKAFNHLEETGFALDGKHAAVAADCAKCHKTRSFLGLSPACASCHQDPHKGTLGANCIQCHSTSAGFKDTERAFDHSKTAFPLSAAHLAVACAKCHVDKVYKGIKFARCTDCHSDPHRSAFGAACADCHTGPTWRTDKVDHSRTQYPLAGRHRTAACVSCHHQPPMRAKLAFDRCAVCHTDPHKGEFKQDCVACHTPDGFKSAKFDHGKETGFPLTGEHATLPCSSCHKSAAGTRGTGSTSELLPSHRRRPHGAPGVELAAFVIRVAAVEGSAPRAGRSAVNGRDFRGLSTACASCHQDPHQGAFGAKCESCHTSQSFKVTTFTHPRFPEFFAGQHAAVACAKCHGGEGVAKTGITGKPVAGRTYRALSTECASCHKDVHLGQLGNNCQTCHSIGAAKFAAVGFSHANAPFQLTGKHAAVECAKCHGRETATFPAGSGEAVRYVGVATACASCHKDVHLGQFGANCQTCHTTATFKIAAYTHKGDAGFHAGAHATAKCQQCHKSVEGDFPAGHGVAIKFAGLSSACANCHEDVHKGTLGTRCESCHTPDKWAGASRAFHKATLFPLEGMHLGVPCASCHLNGQVKGTPDRCYDCHWVRHQDDRFRTRLGTNCENCHRPISWRAVIWNHGQATGFQLSAAHASLDCASCHHDSQFGPGTPTDCYSCHRPDYEAAKSPPHAAAGFPTACESCHKASDTTWHQATFNHATTAFPLLGVHATQTCTTCHGDGVFKGKSTACVSCHQTDFNNSKNPNHVQAGFSTACETCHKASDATWQQAAAFNHAATAFPLLGLHATQTCTTCHGDGVFKGKSTACVSCHQTDFNNSKNPNHAQAGFSSACETCHKVSDASWAQGAFNHATTAFPLLGVHSTQPCATCHGDGVFKGKSTACVSCHQTDFNNSKNPNHVQAGFPTACETCHKASDATWQQAAAFNHATTAFPLLGVHATQTCTTCHGDGVFKGKSAACVSCHQTDFNNSKNPNHVQAGFPTACETCHKVSDANWQQATFNHATTAFPLLGVHATQSCTTCHGDGVFKGKSTACVSCHQTDFNNSKNPNHVQAGFPTACETCHKVSDANWQQATFNHATTAFPLLGVHATQTCTTCHGDGVFKGKSTACVSCHQTDFNNSKNPNHVQAGFPTACETCHKVSDANWQQATFNHATTAFPLLGVHATQACAACHGDGVFKGKSTACVSCHQTDFNNSKNPNHVQAGFPTACETCHKVSDANWQQATFNHATTAFPLLGVHATQSCTTCHGDGVFKGKSTACVSCHQTDFNNSKNPNHVQAGFPTACETCHKVSDSSWSQGVFNHATTAFPLLGVHATQACTACHGDGVFKGKSTTCVSCHQTDFNNSKNPNHVQAGFPTACETCHKVSDSSWSQGVFNHATTAFPLLGVHATQACTACHGDGVFKGKSTACVSCHQTDFNNAKDPNHVQAGFPTACETCHKVSDSSWSQGVFNHATTAFPLLGIHATQPCAACHGDGVFKGKSTACVSCHISDYNGTTNPNHTAAGFPTTCETCHKVSDTSWTQGTFNHTWFPQRHGNSGGVCATCHTNPTNFMVFSCTTGCHPKSQTDSDHRGRAGYIYDSQACYSCHPTGQGG